MGIADRVYLSIINFFIVWPGQSAGSSFFVYLILVKGNVLNGAGESDLFCLKTCQMIDYAYIIEYNTNSFQ